MAEYQRVIITLSDGRRGVFTGPVLCRPGDDTMQRITDIKFSEPRELPSDMHFEEAP